MQWALLLLLASLAQPCLSYSRNSLYWLSHLRSRHGYGYRNGYPASQWNTENPESDCPLECDCPGLYPRAMYCHSRNLQHVPFVPSRMKYVYLHNNQIASIKEGVFDNATDLVWIIMHKNQLTSDKIAKKVFSKLKNLQKLYLNSNSLTVIPEDLPTSLVDLRLNNNKITKLSDDTFKDMVDLSHLNLHGNAIKEVGGAFKGLDSLTVLDLSRNSLEKVPASLPQDLQQLYLNFNQITSVPGNFLSNYPTLRYVRLSHNLLTDNGIPSSAFNTTSLLELDLSHNRLERIPTISTKLENLYLQANHIKEFSLGSFCRVVDMANFSQIRVLRLDGNEISTRDVPPEAVLCLRLAVSIDL
ncbi:fibromodulin [Alosa alosa]|nr:fibromodulin [Alosa alosa]XP_048097457.1 fibromodulin [Alosa alosa]